MAAVRKPIIHSKQPARIRATPASWQWHRGQIIGGVATGLAAQPQSSNLGNNNFHPINKNLAMGSTNFGVEDTRSWADDGSGDTGAGTTGEIRSPPVQLGMVRLSY